MILYSGSKLQQAKHQMCPDLRMRKGVLLHLRYGDCNYVDVFPVVFSDWVFVWTEDPLHLSSKFCSFM
jgi:hypothetical protein